jgi:hypothetical protein
MNYIKRLEADTVQALDSARLIESEINDLISYLCCDKFRVDTRVQVGDVLRVLLPIRNNVTCLAAKVVNRSKERLRLISDTLPASAHKRDTWDRLGTRQTP